ATTTRPRHQPATHRPHRRRGPPDDHLLRREQQHDDHPGDHSGEHLLGGHPADDAARRLDPGALLGGQSNGRGPGPRQIEERMKTPKPIQDERGIAFPMAMIVMVILTSLMIAFAVLTTSESQIASSQMASAQARALAESGLERALWAMTTGEASTPPSGSLVNSGPPNYTITLVPPYDGSMFVAVNDPVLGSPIGG